MPRLSVSSPALPLTFFLILFATRLVRIIAFAPLRSGRASRFGFRLGSGSRLLFNPSSASLGAFGFFQLGGAALGFLASALRPSFGATGFLLFLTARFLLLFQLSALIAAGLVLGAPRLLGSSLLGSFPFGATSAAGGAAGITLSLRFFWPLFGSFVICGGWIRATTARLRTRRLRAWVEDAAKYGRQARRFLGRRVGSFKRRTGGSCVCGIDHDNVIVSRILLK
jgi:hypothetical protein